MDKETGFDHVSRARHHCLSLAVRYFFPDKMSCCRRQTREIFTFDEVNFLAGSLREGLDIPRLFDRVNDKHLPNIDTDIMCPYEINDSMALIAENHLKHESLRPGFCYLRSALASEDLFITFPEYNISLLHKNGNDYIRNNMLKEDLFPDLEEEGRRMCDTENLTYTFRGEAEMRGASPAYSAAHGPLEYDFVPCIPVPWPYDAIPWQSRQREHGWPTSSQIKQVVTAGCHLVSKAHALSALPDLEWRYSFSLAEVNLSQSLTKWHKVCFKVFKALIKYNEKTRCLEIPSYFLKTTFLWVCEQSPASIWGSNNIGRSFLSLLDKFLCFLKRRNIPHYFISGYNLIEHLSDEVLKNWICGVEYIRQCPLQCMATFHVDFDVGQVYPISSDLMADAYRLLHSFAYKPNIDPTQLKKMTCLILVHFTLNYAAGCYHEMVLSIARTVFRIMENSFGGYYLDLNEGTAGSGRKELEKQYLHCIDIATSIKLKSYGRNRESICHLLSFLHAELGCICYQLSENSKKKKVIENLRMEAEKYFQAAVECDNCIISVSIKYAQNLVVQRRYNDTFPILQSVVGTKKENQRLSDVSYSRYTDRNVESTLRMVHTVEEAGLPYPTEALAYYLLNVCGWELGRGRTQRNIPNVNEYCQMFEQKSNLLRELELYKACFFLRYDHLEMAVYLFLPLAHLYNWIAKFYLWFCVAMCCCHNFAQLQM